MIFSSFISFNYYYFPLEDFDIIMTYQTITVSVCSLLHVKIAWLKFNNEGDIWYYSLLFWNIYFSTLFSRFESDISIYLLKDLMATIAEFARENYWATIMIMLYDNDSLIFDMHIMMKMISRYYPSIITQIPMNYQNINSQTNNVLSRYFNKSQYCTLVKWFDFQ